MIQFNNLDSQDVSSIADHLRSRAADAAARGNHADAIRLYDEAQKVGADGREAPEKGVTHVRTKSGREVPVEQVSPFMRNVMGVEGGDAA